MKPVVLHDQAKAELLEAAAWYERQSRGLGGRFRSAVEEAVQRIHENPQFGPRYASTRFRYVLVHHFPYVIFYCKGDRVIRVMAVAHGRRKPGYWRNRGTV
jgi:toxin ParE1/3/4